MIEKLAGDLNAVGALAAVEQEEQKILLVRTEPADIHRFTRGIDGT